MNASSLDALSTKLVYLPAGFWRRFAAAFVDYLIVQIITLPVTLPIQFVLQPAMQEGKFNSTVVTLTVGSWIFGLTVNFLFYGWFYSRKSGSPGKLLLSLRVVDAESGRPLSFVRAGLRDTAGKFVSAITIGIGFLMAAFGEKRALHDYMVNSRVFYLQEQTAVSPR